MALDRQETLSIEPSAQDQVYRLLAQANLLRMRGCWEEAVENCLSALRVTPESASALSLLGDIYENQGRREDAIHWYRMALDASPSSPADRLKLNRLLSAVDSPEAFSEREPDFAPAGAAPVQERLRNPEIVLRYGAIFATLSVFLVVGLAYLAVHRHSALASLGLGKDSEVKTAPLVLPTASADGGGVGAGPEASSPLRDGTDQAVWDALRTAPELAASGMAISDVQTDPRTGRATISVGLSSSQGLTQPFLLRSALRVAAAAAAKSSASAFTVRCFSLPASEGGSTLLFSGDAARTALPERAGSIDGWSDDQAAAAFSNVWWSSQIAGG